MDIKLRKKLLDLAGYKHHSDGITINDVRWNWIDPEGEPLNLPPMFSTADEVQKYLKDFLKKTRHTVIMVLNHRGRWKMNLFDIDTNKDRRSFIGTDYNEVVAEMILEAANG